MSATLTVSSSTSFGSDGRLWFDAVVASAGPVGAEVAVSAPVRVGVEPQDGLDMGSVWQITGQVMATDAGESAALVLFATEARSRVAAQGIFAVAAQVRHDFIERALRLPQPGAGLLPGLAVGDTRAVSAELNDAMLASGLSHLTAVSGANCALVVGAVFWIVALCRGGRVLRVMLALAALASFVVLVTPEPSVVRAGVMAGFAMLTLLLGRPRAGISVVAVAVCGILIADPWLAATPGFALSAVASAALIVLAPPIARGLSRWMPQPLALGIAVPLAAQLACGPIVALFSEQQSMIGLAANLLAAPAAPIATVIGLLACLTAPLPLLADLLAASAWLPAAWIATTAKVTAQMPGAQLSVVPGVGASLLVAAVSTAVAIVLVRGRSGGRPGVWLLRASAAVLAVTLALGASRLLLDGPLATAMSPDGWSVAACDVGQGDALLVRSSGKVALIDTGPDPEALSVCLRELGIGHIDLLAITHYDLDHVGGLEAVRGRVSTVLYGPIGDRRDAAALTGWGEDVRLIEAFAGQRGTLGAASWRVLWPERDSAVFPAGNDASIVMEFAGGGVPRSLFLGDLSATAQRMLVASGAVRGEYPVVKVAHHGSADQDPGLYETVRPAVALFSAGAGNDYGHPRDETLALLEVAGAAVLRTDLQGRILLARERGELSVWLESPG